MSSEDKLVSPARDEVSEMQFPESHKLFSPLRPASQFKLLRDAPQTDRLFRFVKPAKEAQSLMGLRSRPRPSRFVKLSSGVGSVMRLSESDKMLKWVKQETHCGLVIERPPRLTWARFVSSQIGPTVTTGLPSSASAPR